MSAAELAGVFHRKDGPLTLQDVEQVVQEALEHVAGESVSRTWTFCRWRVSDAYKARKREVKADDIDCAVADFASGVDARIDVQRGLRVLTDQQCRLVVAYDLLGWPLREAAAAADTSYGGAKQLRRRALAAMRRELAA